MEQTLKVRPRDQTESITIKQPSSKLGSWPMRSLPSIRSAGSMFAHIASKYTEFNNDFDLA
jgi:hypothetical protein